MSSSDIPPDRETLLRDAVAFLRDVKVSTSPLAQKIQFLESKGLTSEEIEQALIRSSEGSSNSTSTSETGGQVSAYSSDVAAGSSSQKVSNHASGYQGTRSPNHVQYGPPGHYAPGYQTQMQAKPDLPQRDWRDYFIMAVISGGAMYGMISLAKKFLLPHLRPPTTTAFEQTSTDLTAQFDEATQILADLQKQTGELQESVEGERVKVDKVVGEVEEAVDAVRKGEQKWREEMRDLRDEIEEVKDLVPKVCSGFGFKCLESNYSDKSFGQMIEKHAQAQASSLQELQAELKSLRTLLVARNKPLASPSAIASSASRSASPFGNPATSSQTQQGETEISMAANALLAPRATSAGPPVMGASRPSIPAWQLASNPSMASRPATPASDDAKDFSSSKTTETSGKADGKKPAV
ncbi:hypothetical protein QFC21_004332 [Naganishia friedmannii]|uniref:Uncharacterized protein n=1 Tax=Naganishia friedmannii TaxID=89922 RepID=A0ACC2VI62_9TREE|nr:hypothetical protein QFC21_004332 [Naganishia friedmannii]